MRIFDRKFGVDFLAGVPCEPGIYRIYDAAGALLYIGKARNLRRRLSQYRTTRGTKRDRKRRALVRSAARIEWQTCTSELDASLTEMRLNKLGGEESWRLIETSVTKPLAKLQEQDMERQKQALETLVSSAPEPLESIIERQQTINDALKKILENMSQWDSFIDIINQVNSIIKIQEAARRMTEDLKAKQVESIFDM